MTNIIGQVSKIRMIKFDKQPLLRFTLTTEQSQMVNCLIAKHSLNFLADVKEGMRIVICGDFNKRGQFVVKQYSVIGKTQIMMEIESLYKVH